MTTTLITGGTKFLGPHLCERLVASAHEALCMDNFHTACKANIRHWLDKPNFEVIRHDVWLPTYVEADRVFDMAFPASPIHYQRDPVAAAIRYCSCL